MDFHDPAAGGQLLKMPGDERAEQDRGYPGLGDAVGNGQPRITDCGQLIGWLPLSVPAASR